MLRFHFSEPRYDYDKWYQSYVDRRMPALLKWTLLRTHIFTKLIVKTFALPFVYSKSLLTVS
jgi:hypothetical protein